MRVTITALLLATTGLASAQGHALRFTAHRQGVVIPDCPALDITGNMTLEAWVRPDEAAREEIFKFIFSKNHGGIGYALVMIGSGDEQRYQFEVGGPKIVEYGMYQGYNEAAFRGTWVHLAAVADDKLVSLFINGIACGSVARTGPFTTNDLPLWIGGSLWSSFRGTIDEVRIWNVARTHTQIVQNKGRYLRGNEAGLVGYFSFDEGWGRKARNKTRLTPDGVIGGAWKNPDVQDFWVSSRKAPARELPKWVSGVRLGKPLGR